MKPAAHLAPIPRTTATDEVERALRTRILDGRFLVGERLPAERPLAEQLGVNRVTLRSALARLSAAGLVEAKRGSGYVVRDFRRDGGPGLLLELARRAAPRHRQSIAAELLLVRRHLARAVLEKLSPGVSAAVLAAIERQVVAFALLVENGAHPDELAAADKALLHAVVDAAGSTVLSLCLNPVLDVVDGLPELAAAIYADPEASLAAWRFVLAWLRSPDPAGIEALVDTMAARDALTTARLAPRPRVARSVPS